LLVSLPGSLVVTTSKASVSRRLFGMILRGWHRVFLFLIGIGFFT
jgi:hypothetical protein